MLSIRSKITNVNFVLLFLLSFLLIWGLATLSMVSAPFSLQKYNTAWHYLLQQIIRLGIGLFLGIVLFFLPLKTLKKMAPALFFLSIILLLLVFAPGLGLSEGGAKRWLNLGFFSIQPAEFLKLAFIIYLAAWLSSKEKESKKKSFLKTFLPLWIIFAVLILILIAQPDFSTLAIIFVTGLIMYLASGKPLWQIICSLSAGAGGAFLLIKTAPYRTARLFTFLNPDIDPLGLGYQLRQSLIALGSGRIWGIGQGLSFGLSRQKFGFLPQPMTDSIFAIVGEELGFVGALTLVISFLGLAGLLLALALKQKNSFNKLIIVGIGFWLVFQAFFNIAGIIGIMPLGGVPLPFFSYGGSHLLVELAACGLLLNVTRKEAS